MTFAEIAACGVEAWQRAGDVIDDFSRLVDCSAVRFDRARQPAR